MSEIASDDLQVFLGKKGIPEGSSITADDFTVTVSWSDDAEG